jgi:hypothetical protein
MGELNVIRQKDGKKLREYSTRVKELKALIIRSQRRTAGADGVAELDQAKLNATLAKYRFCNIKKFHTRFGSPSPSHSLLETTPVL